MMISAIMTGNYRNISNDNSANENSCLMKIIIIIIQGKNNDNHNDKDFTEISISIFI